MGLRRCYTRLRYFRKTSVSETMHSSSDDKHNGLVSILKCCHTPCISTPCSVVLNSIALQKDNANQLASWRVKITIV